MPRRKRSSAAEKPSKAELIRQSAQTLGKSARPGQIVAALKEQGVVVQYGQVRKALGASKGGRKRRHANALAKKTSATSGSEMTKAERIRQAAKTLGKRVRPRDVIADLAKEGVKVSSAQVSVTLRSAGYRRRRRGRKAAATTAAAVATADGLNVEALVAAKALIAKVGSVETAEEALRVLKKLS